MLFRSRGSLNLGALAPESLLPLRLLRHQRLRSFPDDLRRRWVLVRQHYHGVRRIQHHIKMCAHARKSAAVPHQSPSIKIADLHGVSITVAAGTFAMLLDHLGERGFAYQLAIEIGSAHV